MNLVFVGSSPRAFGAEQHFIGMAKACHSAGHRVIAVVRAGSEVAAQLQDAGVEVRATPFRGGADPRAMLAVYKAIRSIGADWLITPHQKHFWPLYLLSRLTGTRLAVFRHMIYVRSWVMRVVFPRLVDRFFVVSNYALEALVKAGAPRQRLTRLYNPIDLQQFRPDASLRSQLRAELNLPPETLLVGFVGRHESTKGVRLLREALLEAMDADSNIHALWVGGGREWLESRGVIQASVHRDRHHFVEWTRSPEKMYAALDCLVAPSHSLETFGRVVAEAQACGVPVIASTIGGLSEAFIAGQTGHAFGGYGPSTLAEQIVGLVRNEGRRRALSRAGLAFVRRFDSRLIVQSFLQYLRMPKDELAHRRSESVESFSRPPTGWVRKEFGLMSGFRNLARPASEIGALGLRELLATQGHPGQPPDVPLRGRKPRSNRSMKRLPTSAGESASPVRYQ